ncbi:ribonuclease D [Rickettsiales bacterium]|nr:ribonuclease D [Rickettsiales bacterium]
MKIIMADIGKIVFLNNDTIDKFIDTAFSSGCVALDTEFVSESYFAQLSLIQFSFGDNEKYVLDFLDKSWDLSKICTVLTSKFITKVIHSAGRDVEAIKYAFGVDVFPVMDTQLMAQELGYGEQTSYAFLVERFFGIVLDKKYQYSNWMKRPIDEDRLMYASLDVYYLMDIYGRMYIDLDSKQMENVAKSANDLLRRSIIKKTPMERWKKFKNKESVKNLRMSSADKVVLKGIFLLREYVAIKHNMLSRLILSDKMMFSLAVTRSLDVNKLKSIAKLPPFLEHKDIISFIRTIRSGQYNVIGVPVDQEIL